MPLPASQSARMKKHAGWVLLAFLCLLGARLGQARPQNSKTEDAADLVQQGRNLLQSRHPQQARAILEKAVRQNPKSADAWKLLGDANTQLGSEAEAIQDYEATLKLQPNSPGALYNLAIFQLHRGDYKAAVQYLQTFHHEWPQDQQVLFLLADCLFRLGRDQETRLALQEAHLGGLGEAPMRSILARQLMLTGSAVQAVALLTDNTNAPLSADDLDILAQSCLALNRLDEARKYGESAAAKDDVRESSLIVLANVYQMRGRDSDAIALLERHRARFSRSPRYLFTLAFSFYNRKDFAAAGELLDQVVSQDPHLAQAFYLKGSCLANLGKLQEALPNYETAVRLQPDRFLYQFQLGRTLSILGHKDQAEEHLKRSVELDGAHAPARYELAKIYSETSRNDLARQQLEAAIKADPGFESSYYLLGRIYSSQGRHGDAARLMSQLQTLQRQHHQESERALQQVKPERMSSESQNQ
jgi:tetratricopeptide (TPR) repeat protein